MLDWILEKVSQTHEEIFSIQDLINPMRLIIVHYLNYTDLPLGRLKKLHAVLTGLLDRNLDSEETQNLYLEVLMVIHFLSRNPTPEMQQFITEVVIYPSNGKLENFVSKLKSNPNNTRRNENFLIVYLRLLTNLSNHTQTLPLPSDIHLGTWYELAEYLQLRILPTGALLGQLSGTEENKDEVPYFAPCDTLEESPACIKTTVAFFEHYIQKESGTNPEEVKRSEALLKVFYMHLHFLDYFSNFEALCNAVEAFSKGEINPRVFGVSEEDIIKQISFEKLQNGDFEAYSDQAHSLITKSDHFVFCAELWKYISVTYTNIDEIKDKFKTFMNMQFIELKQNWYFKNLWCFSEFKALDMITTDDTKGTIPETSVKTEESKSSPSAPNETSKCDDTPSQPKPEGAVIGDEGINFSEPLTQRSFGKFLLKKFPQALNIIYYFLHDSQSNEDLIENLKKISERNHEIARQITTMTTTLVNTDTPPESKRIFSHYIKKYLLPEPKMLDSSKIAGGLVAQFPGVDNEAQLTLGSFLAALILRKESEDESKLTLDNINKLLEAANIPASTSVWQLIFSDPRLLEEIEAIGSSSVSSELAQIEERYAIYGSKSKAEVIMEENPYGALFGGEIDETEYY